MKRSILILAMFSSACDAEETCSDPFVEAGDAAAFRKEGLEYFGYIKSWGGAKIRSSEFAEAVLVCADIEDPSFSSLSLTGQQPDVLKDLRVAGLGGSAYVSSKWWKCMTSYWKANGVVIVNNP